MKYAILIHLLDWKHQKDIAEIDKDISFINLHSHPAGNLYKTICRENYVDEGCPYSYRTAILLSDVENDHSFFPSNEEFSISTTLLNLLTLLKKGTLGDCRVISSRDDFQSMYGTYLIYQSQTEIMDSLNIFHTGFDEETENTIKLIWGNLKEVWKKSSNSSRINNVLSFYYFSWHTLSLEQTGICISIVLETLFSPHSNSELIHQISFNTAKFSENDSENRIKVFKYVKKYYSVRSKLVHGDIISINEYGLITEFFKFISEIILKILKDPKLIHIFNDNNERKKYFDEVLFN